MRTLPYYVTNQVPGQKWKLSYNSVFRIQNVITLWGHKGDDEISHARARTAQSTELAAKGAVIAESV
jgi:hypothetical protein